MSLRSRVLDLGYSHVVRPILFKSSAGDPEKAHERTLAAVARVGDSSVARRALAALLGGSRQPLTVAGIRFGGVVGVAAGLDKNGMGVKAWGALGFGHAELGTVTSIAQPGNEAPRLFRLPDSSAVINRMGFNNLGAKALADRLAAADVQRGNNAVGIPVGISIGKTKVTPLESATQDYLDSFTKLSPHADYIAVNVSSPNTPGLRSLQDAAALEELLQELVGAATSQAVWAVNKTPCPIFVKIAPDLTEAALDQVLEVVTNTGVQGLIATNTTLARDRLSYTDWAQAAEAGGLSGAPLTIRARQVVSYLTSNTSLPVIGVGGIMTAADGTAMLDAGASLLQVYTGYVFAGPALVAELNQLGRRQLDSHQQRGEQ